VCIQLLQKLEGRSAKLEIECDDERHRALRASEFITWKLDVYIASYKLEGRLKNSTSGNF
jgi:hypothetical protein